MCCGERTAQPFTKTTFSLFEYSNSLAGQNVYQGKMCTPKKKPTTRKDFLDPIWIRQCVIRLQGRLKRKIGLFAKLSDIWIQSCPTSVVECVLGKEYGPMFMEVHTSSSIQNWRDPVSRNVSEILWRLLISFSKLTGPHG